MKFLNKLNFSKLVGKQNTDLYAASSAMGIVISDDDSPESYIKVGRIVQRMWLTATKLELSIQPITGALFLRKSVEDEEKHKV